MPFSQWEGLCTDPLTTAAALDRLVHHSVIVELNLPSYRREQARGRKTGRQTLEAVPAAPPAAGAPPMGGAEPLTAGE